MSIPYYIYVYVCKESLAQQLPQLTKYSPELLPSPEDADHLRHREVGHIQGCGSLYPSGFPWSFKASFQGAARGDVGPYEGYLRLRGEFKGFPMGPEYGPLASVDGSELWTPFCEGGV